MYKISSESIQFVIDENVKLISLKNLNSSLDYAGGGALWRIIYSQGQELEKEIPYEECRASVKVSGSEIFISYAKLGTLAVELEIKVSVENDEVDFEASIKNNAEGIEIRELHFPIVKNCALAKDQRLIWSHIGGQRINDPYKEVLRHHTQYMAKDNYEVRMSSLYPGMAAANAFVFENGSDCLYFGSHDMSFQYTMHLMGATDKGLSPMMVKYPMISAGESWNCKGYVIAPYSGTWHVAAKKYRAWADAWFKPDTSSKLVRDINGWQRIIMRHQYGEIHYRYDQLEQVYKDGAAAGIDTIFMFGWNRDGHDAGYPEYEPDKSQGGFEALKENIGKFRKAGGKVILYFNGQLIDMNTEFYHKKGKYISVKKADGNEHMEVYPFGGNGTALREFGNKTFVTACPACKEWLEVLKSCVDEAVALGCDGVFFDQLGWLSRPCYDKSHGHAVPLMAPVKAKADMLEKLRAHIKKVKPDMPIGIEWLSDLTAAHVDFVHNMDGGNRASNDWQANGEKPDYRNFMDWFFYIFPEVRTTDREIRDDTNIEPRVNRALRNGFRSDVEIYRCRRTIAETPNYAKYLKEANRLRDRYRHLILNGKFIDKDVFSLANDEIDSSSFSAGDEVAVILTQSHKDSISGELTVAGAELLDYDGLNKFEVKDKGNGRFSVSLGRHGLVVIRCRKK